MICSWQRGTANGAVVIIAVSLAVSHGTHDARACYVEPLATLEEQVEPASHVVVRQTLPAPNDPAVLVARVQSASDARTRCPASPFDNEWQLPDPRIVCQEIDDYHRCLEAREQLSLARHGDKVYRIDEGVLVFRTGSGEEFVLRNDTVDRYLSERYYYYAILDDHHLVGIQFYEAYGYALLNADTGRLTKIGGLPHLSPNRQWLASARGAGIWSNRSTIDIWQAEADGFVRSYAAHFRVGPPMPGPETSKQATVLREYSGEPLLRWVTDDTVRVCWRFLDDERPIETLGYIQFDGKDWRSAGAME